MRPGQRAHSQCQALTCITIIGDWNADVSNDKHQFGNYLNQFCSDIGLIISSELKLPEDSFTYKSDSWHTTSWIDHCVSSKDGHEYAIRAIKQRENALRRESLAKKMTSNSNCAFWNEIKKMNNVNTPLPNCIAGVSGGSNISEFSPAAK